MEKIRFVTTDASESDDTIDGKWEGGALLDALHSLNYSVQARPVAYDYRLMRQRSYDEDGDAVSDYVDSDEITRMALLIVGSKDGQPQG